MGPEELAGVLDAAVRVCVEGKDVAVAFSGGVDCTVVALLAKKYAHSVRLYTVGTETSHDVILGKESSEHLDLPWTHIEITENSLESLLERMIKITGTTDPLMISFEIPFFAVAENASEPILIGGQGADEIFAGYSKYVGISAEEMREKMSEDFERFHSCTKVHERKTVDYFGKDVCYPYMDDEVIKAASMFSLDVMNDDDLRKLPLRKAAEYLGVGKSASEKKKAAQYGSGAMSLLRKIANKKGKSVNELIDDICTRCIENE